MVRVAKCIHIYTGNVFIFNNNHVLFISVLPSQNTSQSYLTSINSHVNILKINHFFKYKLLGDIVSYVYLLKMWYFFETVTL